jgi:hypothetical protein
MSKPTRQGALKPKTRKDSVIIESPSNDPIVMSADEADLSGIRMLEEAASARENQNKGQRSE